MNLIPEPTEEERREEARREVDRIEAELKAKRAAERAEFERTGGPVYPINKTVFGITTETIPGLTIRDYFAAQVLPFLLENLAQCCNNPKMVAARAYVLSDAMLSARKAVNRG